VSAAAAAHGDAGGGANAGCYGNSLPAFTDDLLWRL